MAPPTTPSLPPPQARPTPEVCQPTDPGTDALGKALREDEANQPKPTKAAQKQAEDNFKREKEERAAAEAVLNAAADRALPALPGPGQIPISAPQSILGTQVAKVFKDIGETIVLGAFFPPVSTVLVAKDWAEGHRPSEQNIGPFPAARTDAQLHTDAESRDQTRWNR